jgi:Cft2 family RNA processing exonuclease
LRKDFILNESEKLKEFAEFINPANWNYEIVTKMNRRNLFTQSTKKRIILTASGMADGWMVLSHLEKGLWNPDKVFFFPGYLVDGTLGHKLVNPKSEKWIVEPVIIAWKEIMPKATIRQFSFLSWHCDWADANTFLGAMSMRKDANILVVHWDISTSSQNFADWLKKSPKFASKNIQISRLGIEQNFPEKIKTKK